MLWIKKGVGATFRPEAGLIIFILFFFCCFSFSKKKSRERIKHLPFQLGQGTGHKFFYVYDEAFVGAFADEPLFIKGFHIKDEAAAIDGGESAFTPHLHADGCSAEMGNGEVCTNGGLALFKEGGDA